MRTVPALLFLVAASLQAQQGLFWDKPQPKPETKTTGDGSAISQLEALTGKTIDRDKPETTFRVPKSPPPKPKPSAGSLARQQVAQGLGGLLGDLLTQSLLSPTNSGPSAAEQAQRDAELQAMLRQEQAQLQAWAHAYSDQMNALVDRQRQQRGAQGQDSLEGLRASLSDGWDSSKGGGLASALSDPMVVDLRGSKTLTPSLLREGTTSTPSLLREADGTRRTTPVTADALLRRREDAQARLKAMMAENRDLRLLGKRFYDLEAELESLKRQATSLGTEGRSIQHEMDFWGWRTEQATQACMERASSLFFDVLLPRGTNSALARLKQNPKLMNQTMKSCENLNELAEFSSNLGDRYDAAGQAVDWLQAKRNLMKDVDFLANNLQFAAKRFEPMALTWQLGKTLVGTSVDLAAELDGWGAVLERQGDIPLNRQKQEVVLARIKAVVGSLQASRTLIAARLGVRPEDLILEPPAKGLGAFVPPL